MKIDKKISSLLTLLLTIAVIYFFSGKINFSKIWTEVAKADIRAIAFCGVLLMLSHIFRAYRWHLLIQPIQQNTKVGSALLAFLGGTLTNFIIPHLGDVYRCRLMEIQDGCSKTKVFGTVLAERLFDSIILVILSVLFLFIFYFSGFHFQNLFFFARFIDTKKLIFGVSIFIFLLLILVLFYTQKFRFRVLKKITIKIENSLNFIISGIFSIRLIKQKNSFYMLCIAIWLFYFASTYVLANALHTPKAITFLPTLLILIMASIGWAGPTQGGIGFFHLLVSQSLLIWGFTTETSITLAVFLHAVYSFYDILFGLFALLYIFAKHRLKKHLV